MKDGFLLVNKPADWTSRDVCNKVGSILHASKVGHSGTLDPFATGLLIVAVNKGTKAITFVDELTKTYEATLKLGVKTDSGDYTGNVIEESATPLLNENEITTVLNSFLGPQEQLPPMKSAIKINGQRLYKISRSGKEIERPKRNINIYNISLLSFSINEISFSCKVSKGTYIRTLGEDIAEKLGTVGHLTSLKRINIGEFSLDQSLEIDSIKEEDVIPTGKLLTKEMEYKVVDEDIENKILNGQKLSIKQFDKKYDKILLLNKNGTALAVYINDGHCYKTLRGLF